MTPIEFKGQTAVLAKNQPEYLPLPVYQDADDTLSCWRLSWREVCTLIFTRKLWLWQKNFSSPLQPQLPTVESPTFTDKRSISDICNENVLANKNLRAQLTTLKAFCDAANITQSERLIRMPERWDDPQVHGVSVMGFTIVHRGNEDGFELVED